MREGRKLAPNGARAFDAERRKRLGQYFTGVGLGRLLSALAQADKAKSILDPMAGSGDLLDSCFQLGARPELIAGVEIDSAAFELCAKRLPSAKCVLGSAFDPETLARLPAKAWDLVIANPPYVRYQSFSDKNHAAHALPSAMQIRTGLMQALELMPALDAEDKRLFSILVSGYSGLSDLAVPSWILCAALVKQGGRLALVVPESWLSRDYATIVHYLLFRWFDVEFVVEDEHASWFEDAQVKTTLIIAKRVKRRTSVLSRPEGATYCHIGISAAAASPESPIGRLALSGTNPEKSFAKQAMLWRRNALSHSTGLIKARPMSLGQACRNMVASASRQKWFAALGEMEGQASNGVFVPHEIHDWLMRRGVAPSFASFESQGVSVGQGLRTGANGFFYAAGLRRGDQVDLSFTGPLDGLATTAPLAIARPVLRRQSELPVGFVVSPDTATSWALDLRGHALPEDMAPGDLVSAPYECMPAGVANVVRAAAQANFGTSEKPQMVWELTAVAPNVKPAARGAPAHRWYMLPDFAPRHLPDVMLARVNSNTPKCYLNEGRSCLIDANFSTMWIMESSQWQAAGLLAFMNSAWAQAVIERSGAVMGGGALKVEATHLRRFPVPTFDTSHRELAALGARLAGGDHAEATIAAIDTVVARALGCDPFGAADELRSIAREGQGRRAKHSEKRGRADGDEVC
ncbi:N-6 DNA methylase [Variovorax guangxiensis]|uniref:site-specific DNA-methyltransferase (adenine-specific) n=1 Tax=Variovorax guangxiensis TaxID=1775474 RepID=A0A502DHA0_9BURK|nr:N-6 DNA methylase [Variovorax guangxiensis]TPG23471.1 SAM-dependent DNA methyltransferase [Variovorax guangxiensis]TPG24070.1 SAM-dependent DNA methyltransferase [Variovorax ginsengisoli]